MKAETRSSFASKRRDCPRCRADSRGFSLIELLVVVAIMAVLASLGALSLRGMGQSGNLTSAGNLVVDLVDQARQHALSKRVPTALVIIMGSGDASSDGRLWTLFDLPSGASQWTQIAKWTALPSGVVVDPSQSGTFLTSPTVQPALGSLACQGKSLAPATYAYQVFLPGGELFSSASTPSAPMVRLVSGLIQGSAASYASVRGAGEPANYYQITLNLYTGLPKIERP